MEKIKQSEKMSLVEKQKHEALENIMDILEERFPAELKKTFESHGREYTLTSAEDCMVAFAEQNREVVEILYEEIKQKDDYRSEQAVAKLFSLFLAYEKMVALYAELRSYYPKVAGRVEEQLPPLSRVAEEGSNRWEKIK